MDCPRQVTSCSPPQPRKGKVDIHGPESNRLPNQLCFVAHRWRTPRWEKPRATLMDMQIDGYAYESFLRGQNKVPKGFSMTS